MRERPILFQGELVRAILEGRKTQTRRPVDKGGNGNPFAMDGEQYLHVPYEDDSVQRVYCPYGMPLDRLWVREQHSLLEYDPRLGLPPVWFWADGQPERGDWSRPRPSIHMPRWASRLTLEVTSVRVERERDEARRLLTELVEACKFDPEDMTEEEGEKWDRAYDAALDAVQRWSNG